VSTSPEHAVSSHGTHTDSDDSDRGASPEHGPTPHPSSTADAGETASARTGAARLSNSRERALAVEVPQEDLRGVLESLLDRARDCLPYIQVKVEGKRWQCCLFGSCCSQGVRSSCPSVSMC